MKITAVGSYGKVGDVQQNLSNIIQWIEKLNKEGADFILFPELNLSGYTKDKNVIEKVLSQKEKAFESLKNISKKVEAAFAIGFPEKVDDRYYISHFLFHDGRLVGKHRKTHLGPTEREIYSAGNEINIYEVDDLKIGFQICYETHFPEISSIQAKQGANILAMPFASPKESSKEKLQRLKRYLPARAYDNSCFVMTCNLAIKSKDNAGGAPLAMMINPKGEVVAEETSGSCMVDINIEEINRIHQTKMGYFNHWKRTGLLKKYYG